MLRLIPVTRENLYHYATFQQQYKSQLHTFQSRIYPQQYEINIHRKSLLHWYYIGYGSAMIGSIWLEKDHLGADFATLGIFIVNEQFRGKGFGTKAIKIMMEQDMDKMEINRIVLHVRYDNVRAIRCYTKIGFQITNRYKKENGMKVIGMQFSR